MRIAVDMDGVVCSEEIAFDRCLAVPDKTAINFVNALYDRGDLIFLYTARPWVEYRATKKWCEANNLKHHELIMGKVQYDLFIEDRSSLPDWEALSHRLGVSLETTEPDEGTVS